VDIIYRDANPQCTFDCNDIIINIPAPSVRLAEILAIMSVWTFKISDILYIAQKIFSIDLYNNNGKDVKIP
jgi:hypothetical protein